jgi:hypothetical protein
MEKHPYDKVRKIEQREIRPTGAFRDPTKNKGEAEAKRESLEQEMEERVESFQNAMKDPSKRIGSKRARREPNPDGPILGPVHAPVERFEQLNKEDRWSKTEFKGSTARISVQDPCDPEDVVLPTISTVVDPREGGHRHISEEDDDETIIEEHPASPYSGPPKA